MPAFTVAKLKPLFPLIEQVCQELKEHIDKNRNTGTATERSDTQVVFFLKFVYFQACPITLHMQYYMLCFTLHTINFLWFQSFGLILHIQLFCFVLLLVSG